MEIRYAGMMKVTRWALKKALRGVVLCAFTSSVGVLADLSVRIVNMEGLPVSGAQGGTVTLRGLDAKGYKDIGPRGSDSSGMVVFSSTELLSLVQMPFRFMVETSAGSSQVRSLLHDPFGYEGSFIEYQTNRSYSFEIPTPSAGQQNPEVVWNGSSSQIKFRIDLGSRVTDDFWVLRAVWQKNAPSGQFALPQYGMIPVLPVKWLADHGYSLDGSSMTADGIGSLRIRNVNYDQTFLARRTANNDYYEIYLINCMWGNDLNGSYDASQKTCLFTFDPASIFTDTNAPAWDGVGLKENTPYFVALQAQSWQWNDAGAAGGLAVDWSSGVASSVFYPILVNSQPVTVPLKLAITRTNASSISLAISGGKAGASWTLEYADKTTPPISWTTLVSTQYNASIIAMDNLSTAAKVRIYRARQP